MMPVWTASISLFLSLYSECLLSSSPSLFLFLSFFSSLNSSFMDVYLFLCLLSRWFAVLLAHLECKLGNMGLSCFSYTLTCQRIICYILVAINWIEMHFNVAVLHLKICELNINKKGHKPQIWGQNVLKKPMLPIELTELFAWKHDVQCEKTAQDILNELINLMNCTYSNSHLHCSSAWKDYCVFIYVQIDCLWLVKITIQAWILQVPSSLCSSLYVTSS